MKNLRLFVLLLLLRACSTVTYRWVKTFSLDIRSCHYWSGVESLSSRVFCLAENVALRGKASQAAQYHHPFGDPYSAIDGNRRASFGDGSCTHTTELEQPWWTVDLLDSYVITSISITNRQDCCQSRLSGVRIHIGNTRNNNGLGNPMWVKHFAIKWKLQICVFYQWRPLLGSRSWCRLQNSSKAALLPSAGRQRNKPHQ